VLQVPDSTHRNPPRPAPWVGRAALAVAVSLLVAVSVCDVSHGAGTVAYTPQPPFSSPTLIGADRAMSPGSSNVSYCQLLDAWSGLNSTGYNAIVHALWSTLCRESGFTSLIDAWGGLVLHPVDNTTNMTWAARNLSFQDGGYVGEPPTVSFVVSWIAGCQNASSGPGPCSEMTWWNGNVTTLNLTGPFHREGPVITTGLHPGPGPSPWPYVLIGVVAVGLAGLLIFALTRARRPPTTAPPSGSATDLLR